MEKNWGDEKKGGRCDAYKATEQRAHSLTYWVRVGKRVWKEDDCRVKHEDAYIKPLRKRKNNAGNKGIESWRGLTSKA